MQTRLLWRRSATAIGLYGSVALGLLGGLVAARELHPDRYGLYSLAVFGAGLLPGAARPHRRGGDDQVRLPLHDDRAVGQAAPPLPPVDAAEDGRRRGRLARSAGRSRRSPTSSSAPTGLTAPFLLAALLPISFIPEAPAGAALVLDGRYEVRAVYNFLTALLRTIGLVIGAHFGVTEAILGLVLGQFAGSALVSAAALRAFNRFPHAPPEPLGEDRREIVQFVIRSSIGSTIVSARAAVVPLLLGLVSVPRQVGFFRASQAPQTGLTALTAPARLILVTEQTRDWEAGATHARLQRAPALQHARR